MHQPLLANKLGVLGTVVEAILDEAAPGRSSSAAAALLTLLYHGP